MYKYVVSVWMITYNHEKYIRKALDSVLSQKVDFSYEIVIGDDYSQDATRKILLEYQKIYPDIIKLIFHEKNIGMIANQNKTFEACSGEFIAMLEGDDYWSSDRKLQTQVKYMRENTQCDMSFHPVRETLHNRVLSRQAQETKIFSVEEVIIGGGYFCPTPSLMFRQHVIKNIPTFLDDAPAGDYYLQILGSLRGGALYIDDVLATYRIQSEGSWSASMKSFEKKILFMKQTIAKLYEMDTYLQEKYTNAIKRRIASIYLTIALNKLSQNNYELFYENLKLCEDHYELKTKKYIFVSMFREWPQMIKLAIWAKGIVELSNKYYNRLLNYSKINKKQEREQVDIDEN